MADLIRRSVQPGDENIPDYPLDAFPLPPGVVMTSYLSRKVFGDTGSTQFALPGARAKAWMNQVVGKELMKRPGIVATVRSEAARPKQIPIKYKHGKIRFYSPWKKVAETNNYGPDDELDIWTYQAGGTHTLVVAVRDNQEE